MAVSDYYRADTRRIENLVQFGSYDTPADPDTPRTFTPSYTLSTLKDLKITQECDSLPIAVAVGATCEFTVMQESSEYMTYLKKGRIFRVVSRIYTSPESASSEYIDSILGYYTIQKVETDNNNKTIKITAYDDIAALDSSLRYVGSNQRLYDVLIQVFPNAMSDQAIAIASRLPAEGPTLNTCTFREAIGYIAGIWGMYLRMSRTEPVLEIVSIEWWDRWYNRDFEEMMIFDADRAITRIDTVKVGVEGKSGTHTVTPASPLPEEISTIGYFDNALCNDVAEPERNMLAQNLSYIIEQTVPEVRYTEGGDLLFNAMAYSTGKLHMRGDPELEIGKSFAFNDGYGNTHRAIVCSLVIDMSGGGMAMDIESKAPADSFSLSASNGNTGNVNAVRESNSYTDTQVGEAIDHTDEAVEDLKDYVDEQLSQLSTVEYFPAYARSTSSGTISPYGVYQYAVKDPMGAGEYSSIDCETPSGDDEYVRFAIPEALIPGARYRIIVRVVGGDGTAESEEILPHKIRLDAADGTPLSNFVQIDGSNPQSGAGFFFGAPALATGPSGTPWAQYNVSLYVNIPDSGEWPSHLSIYYQVALDMSGLGYTQSTSGYGYKNHQNGRLYISYTFASNAEKEAFVPPTMNDAGAWYYVNNRHVRSGLRKAGVAERYVQGVQDQPWGSSAGLTVYQPLTVLYGDRLVLSDRTTQRESMLRASDIEKLKLGWEQKIFDRDTGIIPLHGGTLNPTYYTQGTGIKRTNQNSYSSAECISGLNLLGVKKLRVVFRRNDTSSNSYSSMGCLEIPLEYPLPNKNGNTTLGEWFVGGTMSPVIGDSAVKMNILCSVFYPTGGSLANCSFAFNDAWTAAISHSDDTFIVAIYVSY